MKALALEANGRLVYRDVPRPTIAPDECLLAVRAAGVCSSDVPRAFAHGAYRYPLIMGHEFAGEIVTCGAEVKGFRPGQAAAVFPLLPCFACPACQSRHWVHCRRYDYYGSRRDGAFAEYIAVKAWNLLPLPEGCDVRLAALCEPLAVCIHTLKAIPAPVTGRLAVVGAGFMGLCLAKLAQRSGQFDGIWLLDRNQFKLDMAAAFGFQTVLLANQAEGGYRLPALEGAFTVVIEACGAVETYRLALALCAHGGRVIWMGNIAGDLVLPSGEVSSILRREITIHGVWNSNYQPGEASDWTEALAVVGHETWLPDLISHRPGLSEGKATLEALYAIRQKHYPHEYLKVCFQL
jgi:L-iditol 2-dehydrogenase